jgi:MFS family permease
MRAWIAALLRSPQVRAAGSYPFRLTGPESDWRAAPFSGLAIVNALSGAGDAFVTVALAGSVFVSVSLHAARGRTALGLLCTVLPFAVVGPFVGPMIDRVKGGRKFIVFLAAIGRMAACLMMAAWIHSLLLFPAAFLSLVCSKTQAVAKAALVPGVVDGEQDLVRANSRLAIGGSIFTTIAALLAALIYKAFGSHMLLELDVLVFAATAGLSLYLLRDAREPVRVVGPDARLAPKRGRPVIPREVALAQVAMAGMRAAAGFLTALVIFAFREKGTPVIWYGLVAVASVGGNMGGAALAPTLRDRFSEKKLVAGAAILILATALVAANAPANHYRPAAFLLALVIGLAASVAKAAFDAIVQRETLDSDRSRLFARFESLFQLVWAFGALIPTLIDTSLFAGFIVVACFVLATSMVFVLRLTTDQLKPVSGSTPVGSASGGDAYPGSASPPDGRGYPGPAPPPAAPPLDSTSHPGPAPPPAAPPGAIPSLESSWGPPPPPPLGS